MKDRKFWEDLIHCAQDRRKDMELCIQIHQRRVKKSKKTPRLYSRRDVQELESKLAYFSRKKAFWEKKISFYQSRIKVLEQRTRYQRILRTPVI